MVMFDYFVGELKCPVCSLVSPADSSTGMQTKIREEPNLEYLRIGDCLEISQEGAEDVYYLTVNAPEVDKAIRIIEMWTCPSCRSANWAHIFVEANIITQVSTVEKLPKVLEEASFISEECLTEEARFRGIEEAEFRGMNDTQFSLSKLLTILLKKL